MGAVGSVMREGMTHQDETLVADGRKNPRGGGCLTPSVAALPQGLRPFGLGAVLIPVDVIEIETWSAVR